MGLDFGSLGFELIVSRHLSHNRPGYANARLCRVGRQRHSVGQLTYQHDHWSHAQMKVMWAQTPVPGVLIVALKSTIASGIFASASLRVVIKNASFQASRTVIFREAFSSDSFTACCKIQICNYVR
jgi:hypothetical protein